MRFFLQVCNHPFLFEEADVNPGWTDENIVGASGKMMVLDNLLRKLQGEGRKVHTHTPCHLSHLCHLSLTHTHSCISLVSLISRISLSHTHTLLARSLSFAHPHSRSLSLTHTLCHCARLGEDDGFDKLLWKLQGEGRKVSSLSLSLALSLYVSLSLCLCLTLTHTRYLSLSHTLSLTHTHTH